MSNQMVIKKIYIDAKYLHGHSMSEPLPYDEIKFDKNVNLEDILNTPDDSDTGFFIEFDSKYPDNKKDKTENLPFAPVNRKINPHNFSDYMKKIIPDTYLQKNFYVIVLIRKTISFIIGC